MPLSEHEETLRKHGEDIAGLKEITATTATNVAALTLAQEKQGELQSKEHAATRTQISNLAERIGNFGRTNWPLVVASLSLLLILGAAVLGPMQLQHNETKAAVIALAADSVDAKVLARSTELRFEAMQREAEMRAESERRELMLTRENLELQIKINRQDIRGLQP
jgi:hypothetical protein